MFLVLSSKFLPFSRCARGKNPKISVVKIERTPKHNETSEKSSNGKVMHTHLQVFPSFVNDNCPGDINYSGHCPLFMKNDFPTYLALLSGFPSEAVHCFYNMASMDNSYTGTF